MMPLAVAVVGAAGSGKSTVAREIARKTDAAYLDKDSLAGPLVNAAMAARGESSDERESNDFYREHVMPAEYAALFAVAGDNLRLDRSVVIDAPFAAYLGQPGFFEESAQRAQWPTARRIVVQVIASEAETRRRLTDRGLPRDRVKLDNWDEFWTTWGRAAIAWDGVQVLTWHNDAEADIDRLFKQLTALSTPES